MQDGNRFFSGYFKKFASKEQKYSHIGIISVENDTAYVYHTEASELSGVGFVKKEKLNCFLQGIDVFDFFEFDYPDSIKTEILNEVKMYCEKKTPFDLDFDNSSDRELYCTELIAVSVNKTLGAETMKPSLLLNGRKLYALDDIYLNERVTKIQFSDKDAE